MSLKWRINPVTLKEMRQMTRSRLIASGLIGFLLLQLICLSFVLLSSRGDIQNGRMLTEMALGRSVFTTVFFLLSGVLLFCITLYVGIRMGIERGAEHLDLQYTTALTPGQFVDGKIVSAVILILMFASAALPFMVLSYLLRGINIVHVWVASLFVIIVAICCVYGALLLACAATTKLFRGILLLGSIFVLFAVTGIVNGIISSWMYSGFSLSFTTWSTLSPVLLFLAVCATGCILSRVAAVTVLSPPLSNRDLPLRLWFTGAWLVWGGIASYATDVDYLVAWAFFGMSIFAVLLCIYASTASGCSRRILSEISTKTWRRLLQFPLFSGAENGMLWALGMGLGCVVLLLMSPVASRTRGLTAGHAAVFFFYLSAYICTVRALWYFLLRERLSHRFVGVLSCVLIFLGSLLPYLLALGGHGNDVAWEFGNVLAVLSEDSYDVDTHIIYSFVWVLLALLACAPAFLDALRRFRAPREVTPD